MTDEDVSIAGSRAREDRGQLVDNPVERSRTGRRIAPRETGAIVGAHAREPGDRRLYDSPTQRRSGDARLEQDDRRALARACHMQSVTADINEIPRRSKTSSLPPGADMLIENPEGQECRERGNEASHVLQVICLVTVLSRIGAVRASGSRPPRGGVP